MSKKNIISETDASLWAQLTRSITPMNDKHIAPIIPKLPGRITPNYIFKPILDLHGQTIHNAFNKVDQQLHQAHEIGWKRITVITGKSGPISSEFEEWVKARSEIKKIQPKNDRGAWVIWIKKD